MILNGSGSRSPFGRLSGRQFSVGLNAPGCVCCRSRSTPYGVSGRSSGLKSARTSRKYLELSDSPIPKSPPARTWVALHLPDAREIGLAVQARHRPGHVDLAVACARCSCHWVVHPLRAGRHTGHDARDRNPQDGAKSTSHGCHLTTASGVGHTVCPSRVVHSVTGRPAAMFVVVALHAGCPGAGWNKIESRLLRTRRTTVEAVVRRFCKLPAFIALAVSKGAAWSPA